MQRPEVNKIIDWLIIHNSGAIMIQSLCGNIHKALEFNSNKEEECIQGNCRVRSGNADGIGYYWSEMERFNVLLSFANTLLENRFSESFPAFRWDVKLEALTFTCGCLKIYPIFLRKGSSCLNTLARFPTCTGWPI